jgi:hypothetical protein
MSVHCVARQQSVCQLTVKIAVMCLVFYGVCAATVAMKWLGKQTSAIERLFPVWSVPWLYNEIPKNNQKPLTQHGTLACYISCKSLNF